MFKYGDFSVDTNRIGFTGTRRGMNDLQTQAVADMLVHVQPTEVHHGDCLGADSDFHDLVVELWRAGRLRPDLKIVIHPCTLRNQRAWLSGFGENVVNNPSHWCAHRVQYPHEPKPNVEEWLEQPPLVRNAEIVDVTHGLLAVPGEMKEKRRSGTWHTVRCARSMTKPIAIFWPEEKEN